jgi:hypothetical protein
MTNKAKGRALDVMTSHQGNGEQSDKLRADQLPLPPPFEQRLNLDSGNYATSENGLVRLWLANGQELFSFDANLMAFDLKGLTALMQVYLLGFNRGRSHELTKVEARLKAAMQIVFDK